MTKVKKHMVREGLSDWKNSTGEKMQLTNSKNNSGGGKTPEEQRPISCSKLLKEMEILGISLPFAEQWLVHQNLTD